VREKRLCSSEKPRNGMADGGEARDEKSKVGGVVVFDVEVVYHQDKSNRASGMTEETRGLGLMEVEGLQE
jgi:hypothetical protein